MWHLATTLACALTSAGAKLVHEAAVELAPAFASVDVNTKSRLRKTLAAFKRVNLNAQHFAGVDGYGYGDLGREALDEVYAELFGAEAAIVRVQCFSGTHAIACALFGTLRPGDELLAVSGRPYDTLEEVIGLRGRTEDGLRGTLADFGVTYSQVELAASGSFDLEAIDNAMRKGVTKMVHVQRSCGYAWRPSIRIDERCSPVGSGILPVAGITPGYGDEVVFADGTFIEGSTLELSADGPLREPFAVYLQGGTHWTHWQLILEEIVDDFLLKGPEAKAFEVAERYAGRRGLRNT